MGFQRILIAVDESPAAAHAADVGADLARALNAEVALVHAVEPLVAPESGVSAAELIDASERDGRALLAAVRSRGGIGEAAFTFVQVGKPVPVITKAASDWKADMIVIASHGRGGVSRLVLGSVAEGVMRHSICPVLVVRAAG